MKYGYTAYTFRVHQHGHPDEPLRLGGFGTGQDALPLLYGAFQGLMRQSVTEGYRHLRCTHVHPIGRSVRFEVEIGHSGRSSRIFEPDDDNKPVFERAERHIDSKARRGLLVVPSASTAGLLLLEVQGRSGAKALLAPTLKRMFRAATDHILDLASVADQGALERYLAEANIRNILLRRTGWPSDVADAAEFDPEDVEEGKIEMRLTPGKIKLYQRRLVERLRGDSDVRGRLLQLYNIDFDELSVSMDGPERRTTLTVTGDNIPTFVYDLSGRGRPSDEVFYTELAAGVGEIARAVGVHVGEGWQAGEWTPTMLDTLLTVPQEVPADEAADSAKR
jgi:hypothetical protein